MDPQEPPRLTMEGRAALRDLVLRMGQPRNRPDTAANPFMATRLR